MLKDNHICSAGSITAAVDKAKIAAGFSSKIEGNLYYLHIFTNLNVLTIDAFFLIYNKRTNLVIHKQSIEVECQNVEEALEASTAGADIVMLDNYKSSDDFISDATTIKKAFPNVLIEASGGITIDTIHTFMHSNVDIISQGSLTQGMLDSCIIVTMLFLRLNLPYI